MALPPDPYRAPFAPRLVRAHRARAAMGFARAAFLHARTANDLAERLEAVNRDFGLSLALGAPRLFSEAAAARPALAARIGALIEMDCAPGLVRPPLGLAAEAEALPFAEERFGLIASTLALHWTNDLPGALVQIRRALRPDGLFLAALFGGRTLHELRASLLAAEAEISGGASPRVSPFADALDMAGLLQRAGFALPVADSDTVTVRYENPLLLLQDLRTMGETNALAARGKPLTRAILMRAMAHYHAHYAGPDGRVSATFEIVTATGWAPHDSQQKPLKPGSAKTRLADALGVHERSAGEPAPRPKPSSSE